MPRGEPFPVFVVASGIFSSERLEYSNYSKSTYSKIIKGVYLDKCNLSKNALTLKRKQQTIMIWQAKEGTLKID
jgi:hypothetical protein